MYSIHDIIVLILIALSLPICFFRPTFGAIMWAIVSYTNPQTFGWGIARQVSPAFLVAIPTVLGCLVYRRGWSRVVSREMVLLVVLWAWFTVTTVQSGFDPVFAEKLDLAWFRWDVVSKIVFMTLVTVVIIDNWERLRWLLLSIAGCFGFLVARNLPFMLATRGEFRVYGPPNSMIADNNDFGLALNMALPLFFFLARTETNPWLRRVMMFLFIGTIPCIFYTYSRGALIGLVVVLGLMLLQAKRKVVLIPLLLMVMLFGAFLTPQKWRDRMNTDNALDRSALSRLNVWQYSWNLALDYPIVGGGFEAFTPSLFQRYAPNPQDVHGPHSIYFGVLAEHGFVGLALYLSLVVSCLLGLGKIVRVARIRGDTLGVGYANMLRFSLAGFLASGAFLGRAYLVLLFSIVACVSVLRHLFWSDVAAGPIEMEAEKYLVPGDAEEFSPHAEHAFDGWERA